VTDCDGSSRARLGAWYTPPELVAATVAAVADVAFLATRRALGRPVRVLDPACGDGRFLAAVDAAARGCGTTVDLVGVDIDPSAVTAARRNVPGARIDCDDALVRYWSEQRFDLVVGNPPFLSPLLRRSARSTAERRSDVGPYADAAVEFLALASELVEPDGGRVALVLPQSLLASRDAAGVRARIDERATLLWSWSSSVPVFDAQVLTCVLAFEFGRSEVDPVRPPWTAVVNSHRAVPGAELLAASVVDGTLGDRCRLNANFRDEYYGLLPAIVDRGGGPALITSGLIDPGVVTWGERPATIGRRRYGHPTVETTLLDERMRRWATDRLVPKVLIANQTSVVEAVADRAGAWLPGVPVVAAYPTTAAATVDDIAAVLTSPVASMWAWHRAGGSGRSARTIRLGPAMLRDLPWPAGSLAGAVDSLVEGDIRGCGAAVNVAYGLDAAAGRDWWTTALDRIEARRRDALSVDRP
jgi:SAM-dependent methyltransferase